MDPRVGFIHSATESWANLVAFAGTPHRVTVRSLYDLDDYDAEECYGLIGVGLCQDKRIEFPIKDIDVERKESNRLLLDDYQSWMVGCD